jgi:hypothetical protein
LTLPPPLSSELEQTDPLTKEWEKAFIAVGLNATFSSGAKLFVNAGTWST